MSQPDGDDLRMIRHSRLQHPDPERTRRTGLGSAEAFQALLRKSFESPQDFWGEIAGELEWMRRWDTVYEGDFPHFRFFAGGVSNPTINLLDRHLASGADNLTVAVRRARESRSASRVGSGNPMTCAAAADQ